MWNKYPVIRGMISYSIMYPGANIFQQVAFRHHDNEKTDFKSLRNKDYIVQRFQKVDWTEASRFMVYGAFFHAPLVHNWMHFVQRVFPGTSTRQILRKVCLIFLIYDIFQNKNLNVY